MNKTIENTYRKYYDDDTTMLNDLYKDWCELARTEYVEFDFVDRYLIKLIDTYRHCVVYYILKKGD